MLVAGVDSSTQSTKVLLCQAEDGTVVGQSSAPHPDGTECVPDLWWQALGEAGRGLLDRADAIGVAAQQHGMVVLDEAGQVIRPALLWNDMRSAPQAAALIAELGGPAEWARRTGSVPTASFTVTKLRWLAEHEPAFAKRAAHVLLPHDWLTWRQVLGAVDQRAYLLVVEDPGQLLGRVGGELRRGLAALRGVHHHRRRVPGSDDDQSMPPCSAARDATLISASSAIAPA